MKRFDNDELIAIIPITNNPALLSKYVAEIKEIGGNIIVLPFIWDKVAEYYQTNTGRRLIEDLIPYLKLLRVRGNAQIKNLELRVEEVIFPNNFNPSKPSIASYQFGIIESHGNDALSVDTFESTISDYWTMKKLDLKGWVIFPPTMYGNGFTGMAKAGSLTVPKELVEALIVANGLSVMEANENLESLLISSWHGGIHHLKAAKNTLKTLRKRFPDTIISGIFDAGPMHLIPEVYENYGMHHSIPEYSFALACDQWVKKLSLIHI